MPTEQTSITPLPAIDYPAIGRHIRQLRKQQRMTQAGLGCAIGKSTSFIGHIERGTRIPSLETVVHIAAVLRTPVDALFTAPCKAPMAKAASPQAQGARRTRILRALLRVLDRHADEWLYPD